MTAPNQPEPVWMEILGLGAYTVGGSDGTTTQYGQTVTQDQVNALVAGPATSLTSVAGVVTETSDMSTLLSSYLSNMPLQGLQIFEGFVPGSTTADFTDVPTAVATIMNALGLGNLSATTSDTSRLIQDIEVLFDVFHLVYQAGTPTDVPGTLGTNGKPTWYSAWNDVLRFIGITTGTTPTSPAPSIGTAITSATDWVTRVMQDMEILFDVFHITYQAGTSADPPGTLGTNGKPTWYSAWNDVLAVIGLATGTTPTTPAPTIGAAITTAGTNGTNGASWSTRITNDLTTLLDVFHLTYTSTQWNAAWADLLALFGIVNSVTAPTNPTPTIGPAITSAQASATTANTNAGTAQTTANTANTAAGTAQTTANTGNTNTGTFLGYTRILADVFHLTYNAGSPSDTPTTLGVGGVGAGKPTWYSAWNGLLVLEGAVKATTAPTDTAPTTGTVIAANTAAVTTAGTNASIAIANASAANTAAGTAQTAATAANTLAQGTVDGLYQAFNGGSSTGNSVSTVLPGATNIPATNVVGQTGAAVAFGSVGGGNSASPAGGTSVSLSWTHTIATGDLGVLAFVSYVIATGQTATSAVTYGGVAMTKLGTQSTSASGANFAVLEVWWLKAPASGAKTVAVTLGGGSANFSRAAGNTVSYSASKVGTVGPNTGGGATSLSMSAASAAGKMVVGVFTSTYGLGTQTLSAYNQTLRSNIGVGTTALVIGDAAGAGSVAFSATSSGTTGSYIQWAGFTVELTN